jgi:hypothetical protein
MVWSDYVANNRMVGETPTSRVNDIKLEKPIISYQLS